MSRTLHQGFEARAMATPEAIAVSHGEDRISYGELNARADRLAARLRRRSVGPDVLVGLALDPGIDLVVGIVGILKAGGAYVPLDPAYPDDRLRVLLGDSRPAVLVTSRALRSRLDGLGPALICVDEPTPPPAGEPAATVAGATEDDLAYMIYTSGTTGAPKGVLVEHRSVLRLFSRTAPWFAFGPEDVWTLFHSVSFDFSVWELWGALLFGGRLVIVPADVARSPAAFGRLLRREKVTVLNQTPSALNMLIDHEVCAAKAPPEALEALRLVILGGERLSLPRLRPWFERHGDERPAIINMYGITETTVHVTYKRITAELVRRDPGSCIGAPIPDLEVLLLDEAGREVADGAPGELYVGGPGVARGYWERPALTAERFLLRDGPGGPTRFYRSGDLALRHPDGELIYLGRADAQVKVRGFRIEPAEVEACLARHPDVADVVVHALDFGDGDVRLIASVVPRGEVGAGELPRRLRALAEEALPEHLRPSVVQLVDRVPLTTHGKVDRSALNERTARRARAARARAAEGRSTGNGDRIAEVVAQILGLEAPPRGAPLCSLGMTSLALVRILVALKLERSAIVGEVSVDSLAAAVARVAGSTAIPA